MILEIVNEEVFINLEIVNEVFINLEIVNEVFIDYFNLHLPIKL